MGRASGRAKDAADRESATIVVRVPNCKVGLGELIRSDRQRHSSAIKRLFDHLRGVVLRVAGEALDGQENQKQALPPTQGVKDLLDTI